MSKGSPSCVPASSKRIPSNPKSGPLPPRFDWTSSVSNMSITSVSPLQPVEVVVVVVVASIVVAGTRRVVVVSVKVVVLVVVVIVVVVPVVVVVSVVDVVFVVVVLRIVVVVVVVGPDVVVVVKVVLLLLLQFRRRWYVGSTTPGQWLVSEGQVSGAAAMGHSEVAESTMPLRSVAKSWMPSAETRSNDTNAE